MPRLKKNVSLVTTNKPKFLDANFLGCHVVSTGIQFAVFQRTMVPSPSGNAV